MKAFIIKKTIAASIIAMTLAPSRKLYETNRKETK